MKKNILIVIISLLTSTIIAQGNMQFNQVIRLVFSGNMSSQSNSLISSITVPANKVWKIESSSIYVSSEVSSPYRMEVLYASLILDKQILYYYSTSSTAAAKFPIWLGPGKYDLSYNINTTNYGSNFKYNVAISGLEFNITP